MDPETEKQLAALIMEEAKRLRQQADKEGVHVYLAKTQARGRPNSQFLTATVRGVQQANRMVEVNEMWRLREKELELERRMHHNQSRKYERSSISDSSRQNMQDRYNDKGKAYISYKEGKDNRNEVSSSENTDSYEIPGCSENYQNESAKRKRLLEGAMDDSGDSMHDYEKQGGPRDEGLGDEEIEAFLKSRAKRGRGAVGSRMDETGPYLVSNGAESSSTVPPEVRVKEDWEQRIIGPSMPLSSKDDGSLAGLERLKSKKSRDKASKGKSKKHLKMHGDMDEQIKLKKSKKKHKKEKRLKKEKREKEKRKRRGGEE